MSSSHEVTSLASDNIPLKQSARTEANTPARGDDDDTNDEASLSGSSSFDSKPGIQNKSKAVPTQKKQRVISLSSNYTKRDLSASNQDTTRDHETQKQQLQQQKSKHQKQQESSKNDSKLKKMIKNMYPETVFVYFFNFFGPALVLASVSILGYFVQDFYFVFPSLGPTAYLHFSIPNQAPSTPKRTILGHLIGVIMGYLSLVVTSQTNRPNAIIEGMTFMRIISVSMSTGLTCGLMKLFNLGHPPAGATTLIISLGLLKSIRDVSIMMVSVVILTVEAYILNRLFRKDVIYPLWSTHYPNITSIIDYWKDKRKRKRKIGKKDKDNDTDKNKGKDKHEKKNISHNRVSKTNLNSSREGRKLKKTVMNDV